ncbi:DUF4240 domain-containing protein [Frigoriglobus tundricola]|uniref:DUF4240 domain-containing protein n=1 Tax=Frigoriglobus tundricola TaxID=2774151 RepID=A0A6M5YN05_9BACT|nr:DUF4240 domain-containing protein [Frigoriglobus tundricola]QJW94726.1 hypothetical protein FTUN_2248 [Frigoriglobus tundricola]
MEPQKRTFSLDVPQWFWELIREAQQDSARMESLLDQLSPEQVRAFCGYFEDAVLELYPGRSIRDLHWDSDVIEDVSVCIVAQGERAYREVWDNSELLPRYDGFPYRNYAIVADEVYRRKTGDGLFP